MNNTFQIETSSVGTDLLADIFGTGSDNVLMPKSVDNTEMEEQASRVLKNESITDVLDDAKLEVDKQKVAKKTEDIENKSEQVQNESVDKTTAKNVLDNVIDELKKPETTEQQESEPEKAGRPKLDKNPLISYLKKKIEENDFGLPDNIEYDSTKQSLDDVLSKQSEESLHSILDTNWKVKEDELRAQTPQEFFDALPGSLKYAAKAVSDGAGEEDLQDIYKALLRVEQVKSLDPKNEDHQESIVRSYLQAKEFGSEDQISEQIGEWKENGKLSKKALEYKPALDDMQKEQVQAQTKVIEQRRQYQEQLAEFYTDNVFKTLEKNELAGIKLDKKFARTIADNMTSTVEGPYSHQPVNWLGYGLEQAQYTKPDYEAVMLAAWILNDKTAALEALGQRGANKKVEDTVKLIKLNNGLGKTGSEQLEIKETKPTVKRINTSNVLKRPTAV